MTIGVRFPPKIEGCHVLYGVAGFFALVFVVNGCFLYSALSTHSGVVAAEPYRKGLQYNARVVAAERQEGLGWSETVAVDAARGSVTFALVRRDGAPVNGLHVRGMLGRPATTAHDLRLAFREVVAGTYEAAAGPLDPGTYIASIEAADRGEVVFRARRRLWLKR